MAYNYSDKIENVTLKECLKYWKKILKNYPLHLFTMCMALVYEILRIFIESNLTNILSAFADFIEKIFVNIFLIQSWFPDANLYFSLNGVTWYLSTIGFSYLMFPVIMTGIKKFDVRIIVSTVLFIQVATGWLVAFMFPNISYWFVYICPLYRLGDFVIGACIGKRWMNQKFKRDKMLDVIMNVLIIPIYVGIYLLDANAPVILGNWWKASLMFEPISCITIWMIVKSNGILSKIINKRILVAIGDLSPYAFLVHQIIIKYLKLILHDNWLVFVLGGGITILASLMIRNIEVLIKHKACNGMSFLKLGKQE